MQVHSPATLIAMLAVLCLAGFAAHATEEPIAAPEPTADADASDASANDAMSPEGVADPTSPESADASEPAAEDPAQPDRQ